MRARMIASQSRRIMGRQFRETQANISHNDDEAAVRAAAGDEFHDRAAREGRGSRRKHGADGLSVREMRGSNTA